jgi:hypothetical protein
VLIFEKNFRNQTEHRRTDCYGFSRTTAQYLSEKIEEKVDESET